MPARRGHPVLSVRRITSTARHARLDAQLPTDFRVLAAPRRHLQVLLISHNLTRRVAYGTVLRLVTMSIVALAASPSPALQGVHVGAAALAIGVVIEAVASRWMTREIVSKRLDGRLDRASTTPLTLRAIASFYLPLALTSVFAMAIQPMVTLLYGTQPVPTRVTGGAAGHLRADLHLQSAGSLVSGGRDRPARRPVAALSADPELRVRAGRDRGDWTRAHRLHPAGVLALLPAGSVWMAFQRAVLVHARETTSITWASVAEVVTVITVLAVTIHSLSWVGAVHLVPEHLGATTRPTGCVPPVTLRG